MKVQVFDFEGYLLSVRGEYTMDQMEYLKVDQLFFFKVPFFFGIWNENGQHRGEIGRRMV